MDSYEVIMTLDAVTDLVELRDYIADVLLYYRIDEQEKRVYVLNIIYNKHKA